MKKIALLGLIVLLCACGGNAQKKVVREFKLPEVPVILTTPEERADFVVKHYWQKFDFTDTVLIGMEEVTEQAFSNFIAMLSNVPHELAAEGLRKMMSGAEADTLMFAHFLKMSEKYFYDPNSPMRNDELYIPILEEYIKSTKVSELDKTRSRSQLAMTMRNRVGDIATPFGALNKAKGDHILIFFFNPDCPDCKRVKEYIAAAELTKRVTLIMVDPDQNEGLDKLYDLKAIPCLYLLDKSKRVVIKDGQIEQVDYYLQQNS